MQIYHTLTEVILSHEAKFSGEKKRSSEVNATSRSLAFSVGKILREQEFMAWWTPDGKNWAVGAYSFGPLGPSEFWKLYTFQEKVCVTQKNRPNEAVGFQALTFLRDLGNTKW